MQLESSRELSISAGPPQIMPAHTVEHPHLIVLLEYWERLRGHHRMPSKPLIVREIGPLLKRLHYSDVVDQGRDFRFRLLGDAVFQCLDENQTGQLVSAHPDIGVRDRYPVLMGEVVRIRAPVRGLAVRITDRISMLVDSLWLPFGGSDVTQVMGMSVLTTLEQ
jgi:hypothetical protein